MARRRHATLGRHVARRYAAASLVTLVALVALMTAITLVETSKHLAGHADAGRVALMLGAALAAEQAHLMLPVAQLLGLAVLGAGMARTGELAGLQAQGVGTRALATPVLAVAFALAAGASVVAEAGLPRAAALKGRLMAQQVRRIDVATLYFERRLAWHKDGPWLLHLPALDAAGTGFMRPSAYLLEAGRVRAAWDGDHLVHRPGVGWVLEGAVMHALDASTPPLVAAQGSAGGAAGDGRDAPIDVRLPLRVGPDALLAHTGNPRQLGRAAAQALIARRRALGHDATLHALEVHARLLHLWTGPALVWAGLPWALRPDRRRSLPGLLCACVGAVAALLCITQLARMLALAHRLPVWAAAAAPVALGLTMALLSAAAAWGRPGHSRRA